MNAARPLLLAGLCALALSAAAQTTNAPDPYAGETPAERNARLAWWREARFGLCIHWGVYAVPAGLHNGQPVGGGGESIMRRASMPVATYRDYAAQFNPTAYDPAAWVDLARRAGMRYLVITAKHHDGFALYDSAVTEWDVAGATPYKKDLLRPLVEAARAAGLRVGFYYSQAQDWVHPGGAKAGLPDGGSWDFAHKGSFDDYLRAVAVPQVRELLTGYPIDLLWWDTPHLMTPERAAPLLDLLRLRPGLVHNNRLGGGYKGDFDSLEQAVPTAAPAGRDWEVSMTLNDAWGYKRNDQNWKSPDTLIRHLVDVASKGGNYVLNVGPTAEGEIPAPAVERLEAVGRWMQVNGEAIHGTTASPYQRVPWGRCTKRTAADRATLYLHIFHRPADGLLRLPGLANNPRRVRVLATGAELEWRRWEDGLQIALPLVTPDPVCTVLAVDLIGALAADFITLKQGRDGRVVLAADMADLNQPGPGGAMRIERKEGANRSNIGFWADPRAWVKWSFKVEKPGMFDAVIEFANPAENSRFQMQLGGQRIAATVGTTGGWNNYRTAAVGRFRIDQPGVYELSLRPDPRGWQPLNVCEVVLSPVK